MKQVTGNTNIAFYLFICFFCIYLFTAQGNNIDSSDQQQVRFAVTQSIIEEGDLSIPTGMGVKGNYNKDYAWYGIGQPILSIPFYIIGEFAGGDEGAKRMVSLMNQIVVAVSGVVVFLFITNLGYSKKTALIITVFYAFGTLAWPQSKHPFDHPVEMLFVLLAVFYAQIFVKSSRLLHLLLSSVSLGFAFLTRPPAVLALLPIFVFLCYSRLESSFTMKRVWGAIKDCTIYSLAFSPFVLIQLWYNYVRFGSIIETGITLMFQRAGLDFFTGTPFITGIQGFLISPGKGFFYYSPISILIFLSIQGFYKRNKGLTLCILGIIFLYLIFLSRNIFWHGDWSWGPRYLFVITPLVMLPVADIVERNLREGKWTLRYMIIALFGISICVQIIGVSVDWNRYFISLQVEKGVRYKSVGARDNPLLLAPPSGIHFEWDKFPIAYQAEAAIKIWKGLKDYKVVDEHEKTYTVQEALKHFIKFNVFDFWWLYALYAGTPLYIVLLELTLFGFIIVLSWVRILRMVNE